jgi:aminopeptidase N
MILEKNEFGNRANDAGPVWMGLRLNTFKTASAYRRMIYPKGGYILHMLRYLMQDEKGDQHFVDTMHDYVKTYANRAASTENFMSLVEKHMTRPLNLENNGSIHSRPPKGASSCSPAKSRSLTCRMRAKCE